MGTRNYIGGSDVAKLCGLTVFGGTDFDVWLRLTKPDLYEEITASDEERLALDIGNHFETFVLEKMVARLNALGVAGILAHGADDQGPPVLGNRPWKGCHEDGWLVKPDGSRVLLEAKTSAQFSVNAAFAAGEVPDYYRLQLMWMMHIFGVNEAYIGCLDKSHSNLNMVHFTATDAELAQLASTIEEWYEIHVVRGEQVLPIGTTASAAARAVFGEGEGERDTTATEDSLMSSLANIKRSIKELEEAEADVVAHLKLAMGSIKKVKGAHGSASWSTPKDSVKLATKELMAAEPALCAKYMVTSEASRRFIFYPRKEA